MSLSFNPRLPGGRRPPCRSPPASICCRFNPRLPGGRRPSDGAQLEKRLVSIHAFRGEGDAGGV